MSANLICTAEQLGRGCSSARSSRFEEFCSHEVRIPSCRRTRTAVTACAELTAAASARLAAVMSNGLPEFGFVFDIDGVLIRGWDLLPNSKESLRKVHDSGVPYLFVTNNGMDTEDERAKILSKQFDIPVTNKNMVLNHSALQVQPARYMLSAWFACVGCEGTRNSLLGYRTMPRSLVTV